MNSMNMAGMVPGNPAARAGMPGMANAANGNQMRHPDEHEDPNYESRLNTYIYGYFLEREMWDCARSLKDSGAQFEPPLTHVDGDLNGADDKMDTKENILQKKPHDLPRLSTTKDEQGGPFLLSWFEMFWDVYWAQRKHPRATPAAMNYVQLSQAQAKRNDQQQQQQLMRPMTQMMPGGIDYQNQVQLMRQNQIMGIPNGDLRQRALANNQLRPNQQQQQQLAAQYIRAQQQQAQQQQQHQQMLQNQMRRDGAEMNGQRPRTPSGADHAPSPSKRQRIDGVGFNGQPMMPNGRPMPPGIGGQPMVPDPQTQQANQLLLNHGINPGNLSETQFASFQSQNPSVQQKSIQVYAQNIAHHQRDGLSKAGGMSDQGSPMIGPGMELGAGGPEFFANNAAAAMQMRNAGMPPQPGANGAGGNHALQDYQMQLMLLEQQNKKRLLMARQEQDSMTKTEGGQPPMPGQGAFAPGMSPQGSRGGPSPQPDQIRRGTPKMGQPGIPGSPMPDSRMSGSPAAAMNFNNMDPSLYTQINGRMQPPPSSNPGFTGQFGNPQLETMRAQAGNRMPNGTWPQGPQGQPPMVSQGQPPQQQPQQMGTPQQRNDMPPPQGVPAANNTNGRPSSPPEQPTPQPANKANPKNKKDAKDKKKLTKKNSSASVAATPASEAENPPATPTSSTPITPSHANSFGPKNEVQNQPNAVPNPAAAAPAPMAAAQPDANAAAQFPMMDGPDQGADYHMQFNQDLSDPNILENFDFEQFLQNDAFNFDSREYDPPEGLEAGAGIGDA